MTTSKDCSHRILPSVTLRAMAHWDYLSIELGAKFHLSECPHGSESSHWRILVPLLLDFQGSRRKFDTYPESQSCEASGTCCGTLAWHACRLFGAPQDQLLKNRSLIRVIKLDFNADLHLLIRGLSWSLKYILWAFSAPKTYVSSAG